jgi:glucosamine 6-phosphate synthetase-like amidotransferase/phosphosugar isomerase protein
MRFTTETDTEDLAHLIGSIRTKGSTSKPPCSAALREVYRRLRPSP